MTVPQPSRVAGPPERREWTYGMDGDGHASVADLKAHAAFHERDTPQFMQRTVEFVYPWERMESNIAAEDVIFSVNPDVCVVWLRRESTTKLDCARWLAEEYDETPVQVVPVFMRPVRGVWKPTRGDIAGAVAFWKVEW